MHPRGGGTIGAAGIGDVIWGIIIGGGDGIGAAIGGPIICGGSGIGAVI